MSDLHEGFVTGKSDSFDHTFEITPDDDTDLLYETRGLVVSGSGVISYVSAFNITVTGYPVFTGYHPIRAKRILATGTTSGLVIYGGV